MLNSILNQVNSSNPTTDNPSDRSGSVMVVNSEVTRVQQLLRGVEETCPINLRFKEKCPNYDWDGTRKSWEVFFQRKEVQSGLGFVDGKPKNNSVSLAGKVELFAQACELTSLNIPVIAFTADKKPFPNHTGFRQKLYDSPLSASDLLKSYKSTNAVGLAILTGPISPKYDLVAFDFEFPELKEKFISMVEAELPNLVDAIKETYWETTAGGGHHFFALVPSGQGQDEKLALNENGKTSVETKGSRNSCIIIAPSQAKSDKTGVIAIGAYKATNGPLINNDGLRALTLDLKNFESLKTICKSFDVSPIKVEAKPKQAAPKPKSIVNPTESPKGEDKLGRANRYFKEKYGWTGLANLFGYEIVSGSNGRWEARHPKSTKKEPNCVFGPQIPGSDDTFWCWGDWHIKGPINYAQFYVENSGGGKEAWAKLFKEVDYAWGKLPDESELVDETRWEDFDIKEADKKQDHTEDESDELMTPTPKDITAYEIQEANKAEEILRSPVKDSLINVFGDTYKNTAKSKHAQTVIGYAAGISHIGHYFADIVKWKDSVTVNHVLIMARTCSGKDHPRSMLAKINKMLVLIQNKRFSKNTPILPSDKATPLGKSDLLLSSIRINANTIDSEKAVVPPQREKDWEPAVINPKGSFQGLEDQLGVHPHAMIEINEFGDWYKQAGQGNSTGERYTETQEGFKILFDCPKPYKGRAKAGKKPIFLRNGILPSILGYSTPRKMLGTFDQDRIEGGALNRWLFFIAGPRWVRDANGNRIKPTDRHGGDKAARKLAKLVDETREFYKAERKKNKTITASEEFKKAHDEYLLHAEELEETAQNDRDEEEGIDGREEQLILRACLIHLVSRRSLVLEPVDFRWAHGIVKLSQKSQREVAFKCGESSSETTSGKLNNKIHGVIKKLHDAKKPLTPSAIGNKLYTEKQKRTKTYFVANHQPTLIQLGWIKILDDGSYELTPKFWKVGKKQ